MLERFKTVLLNNKGAKLAALLIAVVSWYAIKEAISFEQVVNDLPINVKVDPGWAVLDLSPNTVDVVFRGSRDDLRFLNKEQISVTIDLSGSPIEGSSQIRLDQGNIKLPGGARPVDIQPLLVQISLDQETERVVPVKANIQGALPAGYEVIKSTVSPATVTMAGPRLRLDEVESVRTAPIDLEGRVGSFKLRMEVLKPSESWSARIEPEKVMVDISVVERSATMELVDQDVGVFVKDRANAQVSVQPDKVTLKLKGRKEILDQTDAQSISVYVDCTQLEPSAQYELPVRVHTPDGIDVVEIIPPTVKVGIGAL